MKAVSKDTSKGIHSERGQVFIEHVVIFLAVSLRCQTLGNFFFVYLFICSRKNTHPGLDTKIHPANQKKFAAGTDAGMEQHQGWIGSRQKHIGTGIFFHTHRGYQRHNLSL